MSKQYFSACDVTPKEILAGDSVEINIRLVAGPDFTARGSRIVLDLPAYLGYSRPTLLHQEIGGFTEVFCSNPDLHYTKRVWDMETGDFAGVTGGGFKGMAQRLFVLDFERGEARAGDEILIKWGYLCNGYGTGTKVSTVVLAKEFYNTIHVRYFTDGTQGLPDFGRSFKGYDRPAPDVEVPLRFRIRPREPDRIRVYRKADKASLVVLDRFANVSEVDRLEELLLEPVKAEKDERGVFRLADPRAAVTAKALPIYDCPRTDRVYGGMNVYFGDLHVHTAFSIDCIEREKQEITPAQAFAYARDINCLDFAAVTDHHSPSRDERHRIGEENWRETLAAVRRYNADGEFAAFPGFEFRCDRGDTAVVLGREYDYARINDPAITDIRSLWRSFKSCDYLTIPHFHNPGKLPEGEWHVCPDEGVEPVLEIFSCHGSYERDQVLERHIAAMKSFRPDRHGRYFLQHGYRYGFVCNSDGHKGHVGQNGLIAVYAEELTRGAILAAIRNRRVYGTTNARIRLLFTMNGHLMGAVLPNTTEKRLFVSVAGERPFKAVDVFRDGDLHKRYKPYARECEFEETIRDESPSSWYVRAIQVDNEIAYASPIWFE